MVAMASANITDKPNPYVLPSLDSPLFQFSKTFLNIEIVYSMNGILS